MKMPLLNWMSNRKQWTVDRILVLICLILAAATFVFIEVSTEVMVGQTMQFDSFVLRGLRNPENLSRPIGPRWLLPVVQDVSALGGFPILILLTVAVAGFFAIEKRGRMLLFFGGSVIGGTMAMFLLKSIFIRPRPDEVPFLISASYYSFPSGHSMLSAIVYLTLGALLARATLDVRLKAYYLIVACILTLLVGLSRIYLGVHYPTDVIAGWCAGIMWSALSYLLAQWLQRKGAIEAESNS